MKITTALTIPLGNLSSNKAHKLATLQAEHERCVAWHLEKCQELGTTSKTSIHAACYREATALFDLNTGILQAARDKALVTQRSYLARKRKGKKASPPRFTSCTCPRCGHVDKANRVTRALFHCKRCDYESNADRVAAINIAKKGQTLARGGKLVEFDERRGLNPHVVLLGRGRGHGPLQAQRARTPQAVGFGWG